MTEGSPPQASTRSQRKRYLHSLLPALLCIRSTARTVSLHRRSQAIKHAADVSLCLSLGNNATWSRALGEELKRRSRRRGSLFACSSADRKSRWKRLACRFHGARRPGTSARPKSLRSAYMGSLRSYLKQARKFGLPANPRNRRRGEEEEQEKRQQQEAEGEEEGGASASGEFAGADVAQEEACHLDGLRHVIPGGTRMDEPLLLQEAAHYIASLQAQVHVLRTLSQTLNQNCLRHVSLH